MKRNQEASPPRNPAARSTKRMHTYRSDQSSRKRLSYKIDIPAETADTSTGCQKRFLELYDGLGFSLVMALITLYALFADDIRQIAFPPSADLTFTILNLVCMGAFALQMILLAIFKQGYFLRFYFWLDLISTGTMLFDLVWINELMTIGQASNATKMIQITRAGRVSKLGARTARIIRIIRLIRMLRLYKNASATMTSDPDKRSSVRVDAVNEMKRISALQNKQITMDTFKEDRVIEEDNREEIREEDVTADRVDGDRTGEGKRSRMKLPPIRRQGRESDESEVKSPKGEDKKSDKVPQLVENSLDNQGSSRKVEDQEELFQAPIDTKVGNKLKDEIQKNIILMVLLVLFSIPLFSSDTWMEQVTVYSKGIYQLQYFADNSRTSSATLDASIQVFIESGMHLSSPLVYFYFPVNSTCCTFPDNYSYPNIPDLSTLRQDSLINTNYNDVVAIFNQTNQDILSSELNIGRTLFVCVLIVVFSLLFTRDIEQYALQPLENMITTVKRIAENPLQAILAIENENIIKSTIKENLEEETEKKNTEPVILENMIVKIGALLAVGFGEAGSEIIAKNIESHGAVNAVLQGKKIMAVFGFCDIRNFTDATEVLQTKVMNFVNDIAAIVHGVVNRCAGSANKNIGDAFLLVWKFKEKETIVNQIDGETALTLRKISKVRQIADLAVYSFVKIIAEIAKSNVLMKYKRNEKLQKRINNYKGVRMGFGLHVGWAIEGGIGSQFKIDASYLSPNVNMSSRLEAATKQFGTNILISGELAELMTPKNKQYLRKIDCVTVKGSIHPIQLYTVDLCIDNLVQNTIIKEKPIKYTEIQKKKMKIMANVVRQNLLEKLEKSKRLTENLFVADQDVKYLRQPYTPEFMETWRGGFDAYVSGNWDKALRAFKTTHKMLVDITDGPSETLIEVIQSHKYQAPADWKGYRELTQK